jgi:hypothetical protein
MKRVLFLTVVFVLAMAGFAWATDTHDTAAVTLSVGGWDAIEINSVDGLGTGTDLTLAFSVTGGADSATCDTDGFLDWDSNYTTGISVYSSYSGDGTLKAWDGTGYDDVADVLTGNTQFGGVNVTSWELSGLSGLDAGTGYGGTLTCSITGS